MEHLIAGVDEAGRGPLAGPVFAAAVILNPEAPIPGLKDSKQLTEKKRNELFIHIQQHARAWTVAKASVAEIDKLNILQATLLAMQRAVAKLTILPNLILVDGNQLPQFNIPARAIIGGDNIEPAISAASIVAKVLRDKFMRSLDKQYPLYNLGQHKGYATEEHLKLLQQHGPIAEIHRKSFAPVAACVEKNIVSNIKLELLAVE